jgi:hypothetical protein
VTNWRQIGSFPSYEVSEGGEVRNVLTGRIMKTKVNQQGIHAVGLMRDGLQFHRSVGVLVAQEFIKRKANHDTVIHLDGDESNSAVENLMWRPRWYAVAYKRQFENPFPTPITKTIRDRETGKTYANSWACATALGLLEKDIVLSILNRTYAALTYQEFEVI